MDAPSVDTIEEKGSELGGVGWVIGCRFRLWGVGCNDGLLSTYHARRSERSADCFGPAPFKPDAKFFVTESASFWVVGGTGEVDGNGCIKS